MTSVEPLSRVEGVLPPAASSYASLTARRWLADDPERLHRRVRGTVVLADISGFTRLSERLAVRGRAGAEEVVGLVGSVMTASVGEIERRDGDVLVFGGDALLVLVEGGDSARRGIRTAAAIRGWFDDHGVVETSVGRVALRVSTGVATGEVDLVLAGGDERGLFVVGPTTTRMIRLEKDAEPGEILVDTATAGVLAPRWRGGTRGDGVLVRRTPTDDGPGTSPTDTFVPGVDATPLVPRALRQFVGSTSDVVPLESEHRIATIAFVRALGVDARIGSPDASEASEAAADLDTLLRVMSDAAADHGVTLLGTDVGADGATLFLVAGAPVATGEDEERMLRALREVMAHPVAQRLRLCAGVNRGPVFAGDVGAPTRRTYTAMGDTTNLAARLAARAAPGELVTTGDVLARSGTEFSSTPLEPFTPKGKRQPVVPYLVGAPLAHRVRTPALLPIVGREAELARLVGALEDAAAGRGGVVEVVGEAGSGKSRLVRELRDTSSDVGQVVAWFRAADQSMPYAGLRPALVGLLGLGPDVDPDTAGQALTGSVAGLAPELRAWLPLIALPFGAAVEPTPEVDALAPAFRRARLHAAVDAYLDAALPRPALIVLEDVHWADEASLALADALADGPAGDHRLICRLARPEAPRARSPRTIRIELGELGTDAVEHLALAAAGETPLHDSVVRGIIERAGGNPLFVRELALAAAHRGSVEDLPEQLEPLLASRIDRLDARGRTLLRQASVGGRLVDLDLLAEAVPSDATHVRDLALWGELDEFVEWIDASVVRFRHDLVRSAAYVGLSHARRRRLHAGFAAALERRARSGIDEQPAVLALHHARAGQPDRAFAWSRRAGDLARDSHANADAAALYRQALENGSAVPDLPRRELLTVAQALGDVAELAGQYDEALDAYARARRLAREVDAAADLSPGTTTGMRVPALAGLARSTGIVCERAGRYREALGWYTRARTLLGPASDDAAQSLRIQLALDVAGVRFRQGQYALCVERALAAAQAAEAAGDRPLLAHAYYLLHAAYGDLGSTEVERYRDLALPIYEELGDLVGQGNVLNNLGVEAYFEGRWDDALDLYARSKAAKARAGDVANAATQSNNEAEILSDQGRLAEAEALLRDALRVWSAAGYEIGAALATSNLGRAAARSGRHDEALGLLHDAVERFERIGAEGYVDETRTRVAECLVLAARPADAVDVAVPTLARVRHEAPLSVLAVQLERTLGCAALQQEDPVAAVRHLDAALAEARKLGATFEVALTQHARLAVPSLDEGDRVAAEREASSLLEGLGVVSVPDLLSP
jgi:class 3 adenylate cyclase/tetratricopeptide (TPR) repeat protein